MENTIVEDKQNLNMVSRKNMNILLFKMAVPTLFNRAFNSIVVKCKVLPHVPPTLVWIKEMVEMKAYIKHGRRKVIRTVQECATLVDDKKIILNVVKCGFEFDHHHVTLAIEQKKNKSLKAFIEMGLIPQEQKKDKNTEIDAVVSRNIEGLKLLIQYDKGTRKRLLLSGCASIIAFTSDDNDPIWVELFTFIRETLKPDLKMVFVNSCCARNVQALRELADPNLDYPYPEHIDYSPNEEFYEYFVSRNLVASTRLFVHTRDMNVVHALLDSGLKPSEMDIRQTRNFRKINLYNKLGFQTEFETTLYDDGIAYNVVLPGDEPITDDILSPESVAELQEELQHNFENM
jgi:hypothetical protein